MSTALNAAVDDALRWRELLVRCLALAGTQSNDNQCATLKRVLVTVDYVLALLISSEARH
jgi:hypothetical protein